MARRAIVTLPLSMLQTPDAVRFEPDLHAKREAVGRLAMGEVIRVTMRFRDDAEFSTLVECVPMHVSRADRKAAGARAERLSKLPEHSITSEALAALARITAEPEHRLRDLLVPVEGTLFLAGEATDTVGFEGTVHGAIATGERAAREFIERERER